jgi:hypothetical protein
MKSPARPLSTWFFLIAALLQAACLGDVEVPPGPPKLQPVTTPTTIGFQTLRGTKDKGTAVLLNGEVVVEANDEEFWTWNLTLVPGENPIVLEAQRKSGLMSVEKTETQIFFDRPCPETPTVSFAATTTTIYVELSGKKPTGASIRLDDQEIVGFGDETTWTHTLILPDTDGVYAYTLYAVDEKDRRSDPVEMSISLDRGSPGISRTYPAEGAVDVPTNTSVLVVFDEVVTVGADADLSTAITVRQAGTLISGEVEFHQQSNVLAWRPISPLPADTALTLQFDASTIQDLAGNGAPDLPGGQVNFTTGPGEFTDAPAPPTVEAPTSVEAPRALLTGSRPADTAIWINGQEVVAADSSTAWSHEALLQPGENTLEVATRGLNRVESSVVSRTITRTVRLPSAPQLDSNTPEAVDDSELILLGSKEADTSLLVNGNTVLCRGAETDWSYNANLVPGVNQLRIQAKDAAGALSEATVASIRFAQTYDGNVPRDNTLKIFFSLRDLSAVPDIAGVFDTGPNNYGADIWLEGPLEEGETCQFAMEQRENIKYVATIEHYMGSKSQHKVPFADPDYKGADYLAALIAGDVFNFRGLNGQSDRRDDNGNELPTLTAGISEQDMRSNIDCFGVPDLDGCTQATIKDGPHAVPAWTPRRRNASTLEQGDYLLHIQVNLDRDPGWLDGNDFETCWGDPAFDGIGMHRVVIPVSLGEVAYSLDISNSAELSGYDPEGSGRLNYFDDSGIQVFWGPE